MRQLNDLFADRAPKTKYVRKKDGQVYWSDLRPYRQEGHIWLVPHCQGRSHWKSLAAFKAQYANLDGGKIE